MSPPLPSQVWIGPVRYQIRRDHRSEISADAHNARAITIPHRAAIEVDIGLAPEQLPLTVMHECLHALFDNGVEKLLSDHHEELAEQVIQCLAAPLLDMLKVNPNLVEFLTAMEHEADDG